jgi:hypothetical protein
VPGEPARVWCGCLTPERPLNVHPVAWSLTYECVPYAGGDLCLVNLPGYGVDAFLTLRRLDTAGGVDWIYILIFFILYILLYHCIVRKYLVPGPCADLFQSCWLVAA